MRKADFMNLTNVQSTSDIIVVVGVAILITKEILSVVIPLLRNNNRTQNGSSDSAQLRTIINNQNILITLLKELHRWHDQRDTDGVFVWYVKRSWEEAFKDLVKTIEEQTDFLRDFVRRINQ